MMIFFDKMRARAAFVLCFLAVFGNVLAETDSNSESDEVSEVADQCQVINCVGREYQCLDGHCYCANGYVLNPFQTACVRCPGRGESCFGSCCSRRGSNSTLYCWQGVCQTCYDQHGAWTCRDSLDRILLVSVTQVAMATALVLGIIATFVLLYKFCAVPDARSINNGSSRLSIGSLQLYVDERLRDAPPRYSRAAPAGSSITPPYFVNVGFIHDSSVPPPPYTTEAPEVKEDDSTNLNINNNSRPTLHI